METVTFRNTPVEVPSCIEELSVSQYLEMLKLETLFMQGAVNATQAHERCLAILLGLKAELADYTVSVRTEALALMGLTAPFFDHPANASRAPETPTTILLRSTKNMLPSFAGWNGPGDMLEGLSFGSFTDCLDIIALIRMSCLRMDDEGETQQIQVVELYRELTTKTYSKPGEWKGPPPDLLAIHAVKFFTTVWEAILDAPVNINGNDIDFAILFRGDERREDDKTGWTGLTLEIAADGVFGTYEHVRNQHFWDVLLYLYKCKWEQTHRKR